MAAKRHRVGTKRHRAPVDEVALHELDLYSENTGELYPQKKAILANLQRKAAKGKYDRAKAAKLWRYWVDGAAKRYQIEFGGSRKGFGEFSPATREALAEDLAKRYHEGRE